MSQTRYKTRSEANSTKEGESEMFVFNFEKPEETLKWVTMDDRVMGGTSRSQLGYSRGKAHFRGEVRLNENQLGFASVRSKNNAFDLKAFGGVLIRVRGDGKNYRLNMKTDRNHDGFLYQHVFETRNGQWMDIRIPFEEFSPFFRGRTPEDAASLEPEEIKSFGLMISGQKGNFDLEIEHIKVYRK